jgi:hypothetical protein
VASYEVKRKKIGAYAKTLVADTVDTVTFADEPPSVQVYTRQEARIYVTVDGTTPAVGGEGTHELLGPGVLTIDVPNQSPKAAVAVKVVSPETMTYSICKVSG